MPENERSRLPARQRVPPGGQKDTLTGGRVEGRTVTRPRFRKSAGVSLPGAAPAAPVEAGAISKCETPPGNQIRKQTLRARALGALAVGVLLLSGHVLPAPPGSVRLEERLTGQAPTFASQIAALSEPGGYFDTDNLISNERSYLQVDPGLRKRPSSGGAYIGVGPDQNFSYIAAGPAADRLHHRHPARQPAAAPPVQGALRALANRVEYLALLLGRPVPAESRHGARRHREDCRLHRRRQAGSRRDSGVAPADRGRGSWHSACRSRATTWRRSTASIGASSTRARPAVPVDRTAATEPLPDVSRAAAGEGSGGTAPPTTSRGGGLPVVKTLQARNLVIPVVGNLSGPSAPGGDRGDSCRGAAIGSRPSTPRTSSSTCSATARSGSSPTNLRRLPHTHRSLIDPIGVREVLDLWRLQLVAHPAGRRAARRRAERQDSQLPGFDQ